MARHNMQHLYLLALQVLGGRVEHLLEAWEFQRKFGSIQRPRAQTEDPDKPPAFGNFIPGRQHNQAGARLQTGQLCIPDMKEHS